MRILSLGRGTQPPRAHRHQTGVALIAGFKLVTAALLLAAAIGLFTHADISEHLNRWVAFLRADPDSKYLHAFLVRVAHLNPHTIRVFSLGSFIYSALLFTLGAGLWWERNWAKYSTVIVTASFIPLELYELAHGFHPIKLIVLVINLLIVGYLVGNLRGERHAQKSDNQPAQTIPLPQVLLLK